ncbi:Vegetative protein 296 [Methanimicrococcus sp. At1]|uniref:Vegetative protein 296 n=1 Tax=Methanimicrococcus hacksteinii TaxID=3028293 RepID=A0ABU3VP72_9EURY|nr:ABC transporter ATP-binding protein [Methanimicrococcus sp. At1]MDV0445198.1 Vegetative protein 296 [Methanimicrococcus sp. At1]
MLQIEDLCVEVAGRPLLKNVTLEVEKGETTILFGPNGAGKSALLSTIMGFSNYEVTSGKIFFKGKDITDAPINERAKMGIGIMAQRPPNIVGVKLRDLLEIESQKKVLNLDELAGSIDMKRFLDRDINVGFSGGEIKRSELLQLSVQQPDFYLLDEPESGVDPVNMAQVGSTIKRLICNKKACAANDPDRKSALVITHTGEILDYLDADKAYILCNGSVMCSGNPNRLLKEIKTQGYDECIRCKLNLTQIQ